MGLEVHYDDRGCEGVLIREVHVAPAANPLPIALLAGIPLVVAAAIALAGSPEIGAGITLGTALLLGFALGGAPRRQREATRPRERTVRAVRERFAVRDGRLTLTTDRKVYEIDLAGATFTRRPQGLLVRPASGLPVLLEWKGPTPSELDALENALNSAARHAAGARGAPEDVPRSLTRLTE